MDSKTNGVEPTAPVNMEAERAVIGACLSDRDAIIPICGTLEPTDFYFEHYGRIYEAIRALYSRRVPPDPVTVSEELRRRGWLDELGGWAALMELAYSVPTAFHVEYYAQIVLDCSLARAVIEAGRDIAAAGYDGEDRATLIATAEERLKRSTLRAATSEFVWMGQAMDEFLAQIGKGGIRRTATGLASLDRLLVGGMAQDALYTVAARPGVGKTWLACQVAYNVAKAGGLVVFYSYEMKRDQLMARFQSLGTGIPLDRVMSPHLLTTDELRAISEAAAAMAAWKLALRDDFSLFLEGVVSGSVGLQAEHGQIDLVIVDYLQLATTGTKRREPNRVQEVSEISRGLKKLAGTLACPVMALSQLNREVEHRQAARPRLSDLRESGAIEQDSDAVLFLFNGDDQEPNEKTIDIAKQRNGPSDVTVKVFHDPRKGWWRDLDGYHTPEGY